MTHFLGFRLSFWAVWLHGSESLHLLFLCRGCLQPVLNIIENRFSAFGQEVVIAFGMGLSKAKTRSLLVDVIGRDPLDTVHFDFTCLTGLTEDCGGAGPFIRKLFTHTIAFRACVSIKSTKLLAA